MSDEIEVTLPKLGESIMNATIVQWFKQEGDEVKKDEPLLEVSTDKVNSEIPSPVSGIVKTIYAQVDEQLNVGERLASIQTKGMERATTAPTEKKITPISQGRDDTSQQDYYSPALLRLAREHQVGFDELAKIQGTGEGARVTKKDLEEYIEKKSKPCRATQKIGTVPSKEGEEHIKMSGMRKAIAENLVRSFYEAPHASLVIEVDVTDLMKLLQKEKDTFFEKHKAKLTITTFLARAIARALGEFPFLNASLREDTIVVKRFVNLGIAVSVEQGIVVPVLRSVQKMSLHDIATAVAEFAQRARTNSLLPDDVKEGTITMTNFGMSGVQIGIPIIRYPEVAIVGIGAVTKRVMALEDDVFGVRQMMHISLTFDHRVIDGMYGCGFLNALKRHLEEDITL